MSLSLRQLLTPIPEDQVLTGILGILDSLGFQATAWEDTSANRIVVQLVARLASEVTYAIVDIVGGMHAGLARGAYADNLGVYAYDLPRVPALPTLGVMVFTSSAAAPVHTWAANDLLIADSEADGAHTYTVLTGATLNPGDVLTVSVSAAVPGSASNIPPNIPTLELRTPLVGVTVTNPPQPPTTPDTTWITTAGTDPETDGPSGRYNARMIGRWSRLSYGNIEGAYRAWCLEALPALNRLRVTSGAGEGVIHIVGATPAGGLTGGQIATIADYLNGVSDGVGRRPINDVLEIVSTSTLTSPDLRAVITVHSPFSFDAVARVSAALVEFLADPQESPIGGKFLPGSAAGFVFKADLYRVVMNVQGVLFVDFPTIPSNVLVLSPDQLWTPLIDVEMFVAP